MSGIYFVLAGLAAFGFLPLAIILYKRKLVREMLTSGYQAKARVYRIYKPVRSATDIVYYQFFTHNGSQASGSLTTRIGVHKTGDVLDVYYLPRNPKRNTVQGAWQSKGLVIFGLLIAMAILFMVYKLWEMVQYGSI